MPDRLHLLGLVPEELASALTARGVPCAEREARAVLSRVISRGADDPEPHARRPVRKALVEAVREHCRWDRPSVEDRVEDPEDGSVRYLFRAEDGARFEAVRIPLHRPGRFTVCLSSQAGCAMACAFCATGRLGLGRNLAAHEIVAQLLTVRQEAPGRVSGAVFMGQGEPFHNYEEVIRAAQVLSNPAGGQISRDAITISTVGLVPQIRRYTREGHGYKLIVSLTTTRDELRRALLPVAGRLPLADLVDAIRAHQEALTDRSRAGSVGQRMTLAWVLLGGVNDGLAEAEALRSLFADLPVQLNVIDVNDPRPDGYRRSTEAERLAFTDAVRAAGIPVVRRFSVGRSRHSACGMLASLRSEEIGA
jgi:23S rRNA (adenine2503-C2)-methyltransferase